MDDIKAIMQGYNGSKDCFYSIDLESESKKQIIKIETHSWPYHHSWAVNEKSFVFRTDNQKVSVTDHNYQIKQEIETPSFIRHLLRESDDSFIVLCKEHICRYSDNALTQLNFNPEDQEVSSGIVVRGRYLLLDTQDSDGTVHHLRNYDLQTSSLVGDAESIHLQTT